MKDSGVIDKTALVFGQMNEPPGARMRIALTGLTIAEYFRDVSHQDVLLLLTIFFDLYRQVQKFQRFLDECQVLLDTNLLWQMNLARSRADYFN